MRLRAGTSATLSAMARIVMVHGAGNSLWGPASIRARWYPALSDGLAWHGVEVSVSDVEVAFYGDLFRKDPERSYDPQLDIREILANASDVLKAHDHDVDLDELVKMLSEQHLDRLLAQAGAYLEDQNIRRRAQERLEARIGPDTEVVIAHSLGTVVAYETLCRHPEWDVTGLITLGSPLGGEMILDLLDPAPHEGRGRFPDGVKRWVNIRNADDPACIRPLSEVFDGPVTERLVDNGHRVHDPEPYLNNATTGGAVAEMVES
jgi:pimeloyl-ACP methyl ester carboxylesterase